MTYQLKYRKLAPADWEGIKTGMMRLEDLLFGGTPLYENELEYRKLFTEPTTVAYGALDYGKLVGIIVGEPDAGNIREVFEDKDGLYHFDWIDPRSLYIAAIEVDPALQGRGIGKQLLNYFIKEAEAQGYESVTGHFRPGASAHIMQNHLPQVALPCTNFFGTGEDYLFCKLFLK